MLTIFTVPKAFNNQFGLIQRNAILSWLRLQPKCEIILFGDEEGIDKIAKEFNIQNILEIKKNEFGTPLVNDVFEKAEKIAKNEILAYINADIILMSDFTKSVQQITFSQFLMVGRRWDLSIKDRIDYNDISFEQKFRESIKKKGELHGPSGVDYFIFPKGLWDNIPPFALGRTCWDTWFLYKAWSRRIPLINATEVITAIHQNHSYSHHPKGKAGVWKGPEARTNLKLAGGYINLFTIRDADWLLTPQGLKRPSFPRRIFPILSLFYPWRLGLSIKRRSQNFLI